MNSDFQNFKNLSRDVLRYMAEKLNYSPMTIGKYNLEYRKIWQYMFSNNMPSYNKDVGNHYLNNRYQGEKKKGMRGHEYMSYAAISKLNQYQATKKIKSINWKKSRYPLKFEGVVGHEIHTFINGLEKKNKSISTLQRYYRSLSPFVKYCKKNKIYNITKIATHDLLEYINQSKADTPYGMIELVSSLKCFLKYLFEIEKTTYDLSKKLPKVRIIKQPKLPSVYSEDEILKLLKSVDKSRFSGKRRYLIILLAARLGLRSSDIGRLQFSNIDWISNNITIFQHKTGKELKLPLLTDVGNAIIDYLKYERPKSSSTFLLIEAKPPYKSGIGNNASHIVRTAISRAGLRKKNKKFGSHSLRHSLAQKLLQDKQSIQVITEVLGHKNYESSKFYLRIDLESMKQCMLEVPAISNDFYRQKGGILYE